MIESGPTLFKTYYYIIFAPLPLKIIPKPSLREGTTTILLASLLFNSCVDHILIKSFK